MRIGSAPRLHIAAAVLAVTLLAGPARGQTGPLPQDLPGEWDPLATALLTRTEAPSAVIGGKLYVFGGQFDETLLATTSVERYDPATDQWEPRAPMPIALTHAGTARVDDTVWLVGGFADPRPRSVTDVVQIYDATADAWSFGPSLPVGRASGALVRFGGRLHYFGGLEKAGRGSHEVADHFVLDLEAPEAGWRTAAPLPDAFNHHVGVALDGLVYSVGGQYRHDPSREFLPVLYAYDPRADTWERRADLPHPRSHTEPGTFVHRGRIYVAGGLADAPDATPAVDHVTSYDPDADAWTAEPPLPATLIGPAARVLGDRLVISHGGLRQNYYAQDEAYARPAPTAGEDRLAFWPARVEVTVPTGGRGRARAVLGTLGAQAPYTVDVAGKPGWVRAVGGATGATDASGRDVTVEVDAAGVGPGTYTTTLTAEGLGTTATLEVVLRVGETAGGVVGEAGVATFAQSGPEAWTAVPFGHAFADPVVVAGPPSYNGTDPSTVRVRAAGPTGFEVQVDEWDYLDGAHASEGVGWLAVEAGAHVLADGRRVEAGRAEGTDHDWQAVRFAAPFDEVPVVLVQAASVAGPAAVTARVRGVTPTGFEVALQEEEAADGQHADETLAWVALEAGQAGHDGLSAGRTAEDVTDRPRAVPLGLSPAGQPAVVAALQTFNGTDPAALRMTALSSTAFSVFVEEERSRDDEVRHVAEAVGWAASPRGLLYGDEARPARTAPPALRDAARAPAAPSTLVVEGVAPNPSRGPARRVRYGLPEGARGEVTVEVFDAVGRRVKALAARAPGGGWHDVDLGAPDLTPGLYLVRVRAGGDVDARPFVVLR